MFFRLSFVTLVCAIAAFGTPVQRDVGQVEADLKTLHKFGVALDVSVIAFPKTGGTLGEVFDIHEKVVKLEYIIQKATQHAEHSDAFTDTNTDVTIGLLIDLTHIVKKACDDLIAKKSAVVAVSPGAVRIAESDLQLLMFNANALAKAVLTKFPVDKKHPLETQITTLNSTFIAAIRVYSTD